MSGLDDIVNHLNAVINQLPPTMVVSRSVYAAQRDASRRLPEFRGDMSKVVENLVPSLITAIVALENRIEKLEGRPGLDAQRLADLTGEFYPED